MDVLLLLSFAQLSEFPTEGELFRFCFMVSRTMLAPALFSIVDEQKATFKRLADEGVEASWSSANSLETAADTGREGEKQRHSHSMDMRKQTVGRSKALDALVAKLEKSWSTFQRLEEAAKGCAELLTCFDT